MTLPPGWAETTLGNVIEPIETEDPSQRPDQVFRYVDIGSIDNASLQIVAPKDLIGREAPSRARRKIRAHDVLFSTVRPYLRNIAFVPTDLDGEFTSTGICVLRSSEAIEPRYLFRRVSAHDFVEAMTLSSDGTMYPAIADKDVFGQNISLPPLAEQRRIVAKLDVLATRLALARRELNRLSMLAEGLRREVLKQVFGEQVQPVWPTLGAQGLIIEAGKNLRCEERTPRSDERGVIKVSAVSSELFRPGESKALPSGYNPPERHRIMAGDLLLARASGSIGLVGRVALVRKAPGNLFLSDKVLRLSLSSGMTEWVYWFLRSKVGRTQIEDAASGISMHNITQPSLQALRLPVPAAAARASAIAAIKTAFARADRLEAEAKKAIALIDRLEAAILAKAFRGELVPQDPNDEPASVLLERIRARRAAEPKVKRGRRSAMMA